MTESILEKPLYLIFISALLAVSMAVFSPYLAAAPIIAAAIILLWKYETKAFLFLLILLYLLTNSQNDRVVRSIVVIGGLAILTLLFLKKYGLHFSSYPKVPVNVARYIIFIMTSIFISSVFSENLPLTLGINVRLAVFFYICYIMYSLIEDEKTIYVYLNAILLGGFIISLSILYEFYQTGFNLYYAKNNEFMRFGGLIDNINASGLIISISIIIPSFLLTLPRYKHRFYKFAYSLIILINIVGLFFTNSRASIISTVTACIYIVYRHNPARFKRLVLYFTAFITFLLVTTELYDVISVYFRFTTVFSVRDYLWQISKDIAKDHPIIGVGPEMSRFYVDRYFPAEFGTWEESEIRTIQSYQMPGLAHNFYLSLMAELGIPGVISAIILILTFAAIAIKLYRMSVNFTPDTKGLIIGITGLGIGLFFRSFFETMGIMTYGWIMNDISFWLCFISFIYIWQHPEKFSAEIIPQIRT